MKKSKKIFLGFFSFFFLSAISFLLWMSFVIPFEKIKSLKKGSVEFHYDQDQKKITYKIIDQKSNNWISLEEISKKSYQAIVISEDWSFFEHSGVDYKQIQASIENSLEKGVKPRGASTITQQVVKNLFLNPEYSFERKLKEASSAYFMDKNLSKEKILEIYLNIVEFGPGVYGISQASKYYFEKSPSDLSAREGAFLAMLLPNPSEYHQSFKQLELSDYANETIEDILWKMKVADYLTPGELEKQNKNYFEWEKKFQRQQKKMKKAQQKKAKSSGQRDVKARKNRALNRAKYDSKLQIEDNPEFDDDALVEDVAGLEEEFSID